MPCCSRKDIKCTKGMYTIEGFTASFPKTDANAADIPAIMEKATPVLLVSICADSGLVTQIAPLRVSGHIQ